MAAGLPSSSDRLRRAIAVAAVLACCVGGLLGWAAVVASYRYTEVFRQDWIVYHAAGLLAREGRFAILYDGARFTDFQFATFSAVLAGPPALHPFLYPPPYLLLLAPLSLLPLAVAYGVFVLATSAAGVASLASWGREFDWPRGFMLLLFPATATNALTGQNALFTVALLAGGIRLLDARPAAAGLLLGVLVYKPQFFLLVPVALAAGRQWRALAAAMASAAMLVLASAAMFGLAAWSLWIHQVVLAEDAAYAAWLAETFEHGYSLLVSALLLGAPENAARAVQALGGLAALGAVWWAFARLHARSAQLAILLAATAVLTPHLQSYDLALLASAVILLFTGSMGLGELILFGAVWALPLFRPYDSATGRGLVPAVLIAMLAYALRRARRT